MTHPNREDRELAELLASVSGWGQLMFITEDGEPLRYWEHQKEDLDCQEPLIVHRDGRGPGKTINAGTVAMAEAFRGRGREILVGAPLQGQLGKIIKFCEFQITNNELLDGAVRHGKGGSIWNARKPYYELVTRGKYPSIIYFRPSGSSGDPFRSLHVDLAVLDEAAYLPKEAWDAVFMSFRLGKPKRIRAYSTPTGIRTSKYFQITKEGSGWKVFHWASWIVPGYGEKERQQNIEFYGGEDTPEYQHEVAGEHGQPQHGAFNNNHVLAAQSPIPEYHLVELSGGDFDGCKGEDEIRERLDSLLALPGPGPEGGLYWGGTDHGYESDPAEILLFNERDGVMPMVLRVHLQRVPYTIQDETIAMIDRIYHPTGWGIDRTGVGVAIEQNLRGLDKFADLELGDRLYGVDFGSSTVIGRTADEEEVKKPVKEWMTTLVGKALSPHSPVKMKLPDTDEEVAKQLISQTYSLSAQGRAIYSKKNDHINDAIRTAMLRRWRDSDEVERLGSGGEIFVGSLGSPSAPRSNVVPLRRAGGYR